MAATSSGVYLMYFVGVEVKATLLYLLRTERGAAGGAEGPSQWDARWAAGQHLPACAAWYWPEQDSGAACWDCHAGELEQIAACLAA